MTPADPPAGAKLPAGTVFLACPTCAATAVVAAGAK
jgi:hypothetical protein